MVVRKAMRLADLWAERTVVTMVVWKVGNLVERLVD